MDRLRKIQEQLALPLSDKGYEIIQLHYVKTGRPILQFFIDRLDEKPVTIDDCTAASRLISMHLDVSDPIPESYLLEVSSPGVDRPLTRLKDYKRFKGSPVKFELLRPLENGQKRFKAIIEDVQDACVLFQIEGEDGKTSDTLTVPFAQIYHCKLRLVL